MNATATLKSELYFTFYFPVDTVSNPVSAAISYTDFYGNSYDDKEITALDTTSKDGYIGVKVTGLAIADGCQVITCTLKGDTEVTVKSSVESYIYSVLNYEAAEENLKVVCQKLMNFIASSRAYFTK